MGGPWFGIAMMALTLTPVGMRLAMVWRARRRVHLFDDVISYLPMPIIWSSLYVPAALRDPMLGAAMVIVVVSIWRAIRDYRRARASRPRVDGPAT